VHVETKSMSNSLWGEEISTTAYVINKCLTKKLNNKVPQEVCSCKKLYGKTKAMILVGYHNNGAYR